MPDPKYGYDILIVLTGEDILSNPSELPLSLDSACGCGASELAPSSLDMLSLKAAILAALEHFLPVACPMEKTVISVTGQNRCILN